MILHFILALFHALTIVIDWHRHDFLVREHKVDAIQFHHDLGIVTEVGMNISVDALLISQNSIVSGNEEQKSDADQPDRPCHELEETSYMPAGIEALDAIPRVQIQRVQQYVFVLILELWLLVRIEI
ncbi:MAG: hypothetical protein MJY59_02810 [Bacteroidaceae bacterium]|nr:hypothetical protein [Bacteroidaceae bacterium]